MATSRGKTPSPWISQNLPQQMTDEELEKAFGTKLKEYAGVYWDHRWGKASSEELDRAKRELEIYEKEYEARGQRAEERAARTGELLERGQIQPYEVTQKDFLKYHYTGAIQEGAYRSYSTREGLSWLKPERHQELHATIQINGTPIQIRRSSERLQYVKHDEAGEIVRDASGKAVSLTDEETAAKGYPVQDTTLVAFDGNDAVGFASNEFGATGVWVIEEFQRKGLGTYLLREFRKFNPRLKRFGQMTVSGIILAKAYHKSLVEDALREGKRVPPEVLKDYPEL